MKRELGQYFTPEGVADYMASLIEVESSKPIRFLDAGAGEGSLSLAFWKRIEGLESPSVEYYLYEIDPEVCNRLTSKMHSIPDIDVKIFNEDYLSTSDSPGHISYYTHAIMNPPYKKVGVNSCARINTKKLGVDIVNLYAAFLVVAIAQMEDGGCLVAVIPRSFTNGTYYRKFRQYLVENMSVDLIHVFDSRTDLFSDDNVLQENIIIKLSKSKQVSKVEVRKSKNSEMEDMEVSFHQFSDIVDSQRDYIFSIPTSDIEDNLSQFSNLCNLNDLNISVSTGPVVDFRLKEFLSMQPIEGAVPLFYPIHFNGGRLDWPRESKKPNSIRKTSDTIKWLYGSGSYCVVRRFSSKEESRRINASFLNQSDVDGYSHFAFENHLNVFHSKKTGLMPELAKGLSVYLNSTYVDNEFRKFNGHTQVNVSDLKRIKYPSRERLIELGRKTMMWSEMSRQEVDDLVVSVLQ